LICGYYNSDKLIITISFLAPLLLVGVILFLVVVLRNANSAKAYIPKEKFASFKMKGDESVPEMFHRLQVLVNDLKAPSEEVKDKDFSHKFLRCLPSRFGILVTILVRSGLDTMTPNQALGDVMIDDT
jgi:hypothetical protein